MVTVTLCTARFARKHVSKIGHHVPCELVVAALDLDDGVGALEGVCWQQLTVQEQVDDGRLARANLACNHRDVYSISIGKSYQFAVVLTSRVSC